MDVVFNINTLGLAGLGATLTSLTRNCSNTNQLTLHFLCHKVSNKNKDNITSLLNAEHFEGKVLFIDFDAKETFGYMKSLQGDWTPYGRLLTADYITSDVALYLDADLVVEVDVLSLDGFEFHDHILAAANPNAVKWMNEYAFFRDKLNWSSETYYFNSGVLLFNLKKWRSNNIDNIWKKLSKQYPLEFKSADQTLLNATCGGHFAYSPGNFNNSWTPNTKKPKVDYQTSIVHFVGSPKPWDVFGKQIHYGYALWNSYNPPFWKKKYGRMTLDKLYRSWNIRRSLFKHLKNKCREKVMMMFYNNNLQINH